MMHVKSMKVAATLRQGQGQGRCCVHLIHNVLQLRWQVYKSVRAYARCKFSVCWCECVNVLVMDACLYCTPINSNSNPNPNPNPNLTYKPTHPASHLKARECGDSGNFRFCASFDQTDGTPFFPASYFASKVSTSDTGGGMSVGLENGDLLFLAAAGTRTVDEVSEECVYSVFVLCVST